MKRFLVLAFALALSLPCAGKASKVVTVFFASDGGRWTDPIVSAFSKEVNKSKAPIEFVHLSASGNLFADSDRLVQRIVEQNPDLVFLPDDMQMITLSAKIRASCSAPIVYTAIYTARSEIEIVKNQHGVVIEPNFKGLLSQIRAVKPVFRIAVVSGPFATKMLARIEYELRALGVEVTTTKAQSWGEYQKSAQELSTTHDALWPLLPFGLQHSDGSEISSQDLELLMKSITIPTLGYGLTPNFKRSFSLDLNPFDLGKRAGVLALKILEPAQR